MIPPDDWHLQCYDDSFVRYQDPVVVESRNGKLTVLLCPKCCKGILEDIVRWRPATSFEIKIKRSQLETIVISKRIRVRD